MKASELFAQVAGATKETACDGGEISAAFTSDLLSDVMGHSPEESVLLTIQAHATTVAVALVADIRAILLCSGRKAPDDMKGAAEKEGVGIWTTPLDQFHASLAVGKALGIGSEG